MSFTCLGSFLNVCLNICMSMHHVSDHLLFSYFSFESIKQWSPLFHTTLRLVYMFPRGAIQLHNNTLHMPTITNCIPGYRLNHAPWDFQACVLLYA